MNSTVKVNLTRTVYQGRVFELTTNNITLANGATTDLDVLRHPGAAAMVPLTADGQVILIRQFRFAAGGPIWEIPAGTLEPGEAPRDCARRELIEEIGFAADHLEKLGEVIPVPGYSDERIHLFVATGLQPADQKLDADELLEVQPKSWEAIDAMIAGNEIQDAKTLVGLFRTKLWLDRTALP